MSTNQPRTIEVTPPVMRRQRQNWRLWKIVYEPIDSLRNGPFDPWASGTFQSNWVWEQAVAEFNRRHALYNALVPLNRWKVGS